MYTFFMRKFLNIVIILGLKFLKRFLFSREQKVTNIHLTYCSCPRFRPPPPPPLPVAKLSKSHPKVSGRTLDNEQVKEKAPPPPPPPALARSRCMKTCKHLCRFN